jgi:uncharacterized protein
VALRALFEGGTSSLSTAETSRAIPASAASPGPATDLDSLIADAAKDFADYQRLTAEGKLGEAGRKLEELKHVLEMLNARRK